MQAELPIFDSPEEALKAAVNVLGGAKQVGVGLWPAKDPVSAHTRLLNALNPNQPERLDPHEILWILRTAKAKGFHAAMQWFAADAGYDVKPIALAEEQDRVVAVMDQAAKTLATAMATLERLRGAA